MAIDLTGGEVKVIGNLGDAHIFRLSNPDDEDFINADGQYEAEFIPDSGSKSKVILGLTEIADGSLTLPVIMQCGIYRVRRLNPRRTLITIEVDAK